MIALSATTADGSASRIVPRLQGPVTTARSDIDMVVTEFGSADLRGQPLSERARRLIAIAHPAFRDFLERECRALAGGRSDQPVGRGSATTNAQGNVVRTSAHPNRKSI